MGVVISRRDLPAAIGQARQGVFVLGPKVAAPANSFVINIGLTLGRIMYETHAQRQPADIAGELKLILDGSCRDIAIENIDILFAPNYGLDVIRLLLQVGRNQRLYLRWPGQIEGERLAYSIPGRFDYREYNIKDYVDTYIVL